jgi:hypothetical protein
MGWLADVLGAPAFTHITTITEEPAQGSRTAPTGWARAREWFRPHDEREGRDEPVEERER